VCPSCNARRAQDTAIHADTWLHENDVTGLERLCNDGARGPLSLERLSALPDGRLTFRMKRRTPTGQTHLLLTPVAFLHRLAAATDAEGQSRSHYVPVQLARVAQFHQGGQRGRQILRLTLDAEPAERA
jgi:Putative transposase